MEVLYEVGRATGPEIQTRLPGQPSYSTVRTILRVLERKGHIRHIEEGLRYVYLPLIEREAAKRSAIGKLIATFFAGSAKAAAAAFIDSGAVDLSEEDLKELERMIRNARRHKEKK